MASNNLNKNQVIHTSSTEQQKDTAQNQIEFTPEYRQKLEENWQLIKDDSDSEIAPWQRIMRVNKLMLDLKCREMIEYLLKPVYSMVTRLEQEVMKQLDSQQTSIINRITLIENDIYNKETRDDCITRINDKISKEESGRMEAVTDLQHQIENFKHKLGQLPTIEASMNAKFNNTQHTAEMQEKRITALDEKYQAICETTKMQFSTLTQQNSKQIRALETQSEQLKDCQMRCSDQIEKCNETICFLQVASKTDSKRAQDILIMVENLKMYKADKNTFEDFQNLTHQSLNKINERIDFCTNLAKTCSNYMEKYFPLNVQRQVTDFLEYVFNDRPTRWRINWYNEIKIPMITAPILFDKGDSHLQQKVETLHTLVTKNIIPALPGDCKAMTPDEEYIQIALRNKKVHAHAKIIIMQLLDQNKNPKYQLPGVRGKCIDMELATVSQIYNEMLHTIRSENPEIVEQLLLEGTVGKFEESSTDSEMETALAQDQSLEAKIEREVQKLVTIASANLETKLSDSEERLYFHLNKKDAENVSKLNEKTDHIQGYIAELQKYQILEIQSLKQCHHQYLTSAAQFDRKISAVVNIEKFNQQMIKQLQSLNEIVSELSAANLTALCDKDEIPSGITSNKGVRTVQQSQEPFSPTSKALSPNQNSEQSTRVSHFQFKSSGNIPGQQLSRSNKLKLNQMIANSKNFTNQNENLRETVENLQISCSPINIRPSTQHAQQRKQTAIQLQTPSLLQCQSPTSLEIKQNLQKQNEIKNSHTISTTFSKLQSQSTRNKNMLGKMLLDVDAEKEIKNATKAQNAAKIKMNRKPHLPSSTEFKNQILQFKERVADTTIGDKFTTNWLNGEQFKKVKPISLDLFNDHKMTLGIKRDEADLDGNNFVRNPAPSQPIFKEPAGLGGQIEIMNQAAGVEHMFGKKWDEQIFDKKAVFQSINGMLV